MMEMSSQKECVESALEMSLKVIRMYDWLLDLYVLVRSILEASFSNYYF